MHITWHGFSCVKLQTQQGTLLLNPFQDSGSLSMPKLKVDIVASSDPNNDQCNNFERLQGEPFVISGPGEYEVKDFFVYGLPNSNGQTVYMIESEGMRIGYPGIAAHALSDETVKFLEGVDLLFLPVTGGTAATRATLISELEPRVIIPVQYATGKTTSALDPIDAFLKEMGVKNITPEKKVILKVRDLPAEETQITILDIA
ncbi:MAG: MBL fold metallo-hydrolase [Candidatus Kerfeldbacteria bacterium]|nr:MBL fold metallo-hydrolase [Candidatus Kerfeldbacteria bacterium]